MNTLQEFIFPGNEFFSHDDMYVRGLGRHDYINRNNKSLTIGKGNKVYFDTYYNGFSVEAWKTNSSELQDLHLSVSGKGKALIKVGLAQLYTPIKWFFERNYDLSKETVVEIDNWLELRRGLLFIEVIALEDVTIYGGKWLTSTNIVEEVKLGIVVTHYDRKSYVLPAVQRITEQLLEDDYFKDKIELVVVDNSQNILEEEVTKATLIPNLNLGGSGGFTRGLLYLKDAGDFTHCLFMDDDASCEVESIKRAYNFLCYSKSNKTAIAGAQLREVDGVTLFEKGAKFDGFCRPLKTGLNMANIHDLLLAEISDIKVDYGGWWFFAFKIAEVKSFAYPFFVRGDDSLFSLMNGFDIATMNGVACWAEDFSLKDGPMPNYLDTRYHLFHNSVFLNKNFFKVFKITLHLFLKSALSHNYTSASTTILAVKHFMEGPEFWTKNLDMKDVRSQISNLGSGEKLNKIVRSDFDVEYASPEESVFRKLARVMTLNGFLLPNFLLKNKCIFQHKSFRANFREIFRYKRVLYEYEAGSVGYVASYDRLQFFKLTFKLVWLLFELAFKFKSLKRKYKKELPVITSESFWREVYSLKKEKK